MPIACRNKLLYGKTYCVTDCPTRAENSPLEYVRVTEAADLPPAHPRVIDVPVLDMNHGWPNLGHDSIVHAVHGRGLRPPRRSFVEVGLTRPRALVRRAAHRHDPGGAAAATPSTSAPAGPATSIRRRTTAARAARASARTPSWEPPLFELFDAIRAHEDAALVSRLPHASA